MFNILAEKEFVKGSKWLLVDLGNDFYEYGSSKDFNSFWGIPVAQQGSKKDILNHLKLCKGIHLETLPTYVNDDMPEEVQSAATGRVEMYDCFIDALLTTEN